MSDKRRNIAFCVFGSVLFLIIIATLSHAAEYQLLVPLPQGTPTIQDTAAGFVTYLGQLFLFLLSAAIILALVMMVIGGVEYVGAAGNTSFLGDAKDRIINALLGLVLALASWLVLNIINPDLVDFSLVIPPITTGSPSPTSFISICDAAIKVCRQGSTANEALANCKASCNNDATRCSTPVLGTCGSSPLSNQNQSTQQPPSPPPLGTGSITSPPPPPPPPSL